MKICIFQIWNSRTHTGIFLGLFVGFYRVYYYSIILVIEFVLYCMQIVIFGLSTIVAHLPHLLVNLIAKKINIMSFQLEKVEINYYSELAHGLE